MLKTLSLNGTWRLRWSDGPRGRLEYAGNEETDETRYIDAEVPGEVHMDAWKAGWIDDPYVGLNCLAARWIESCYWSYRRHFEAPDAAVEGRAWLNFEGLDYAATLLLNGMEVGRHQNAFYPCRIDVTGKLRPGRNLLTVHVEGGLIEAADKPADGWVHPAFFDGRLTKRHWLRKPQCQFGWDWSTRFINAGITGPVALEWTAAPVRLDRLVPLVDAAPDLRTGRVCARLFVEGLTTESIAGELTAELVETGARSSVPVEIEPGLGRYEVTLEQPDPRLWWPAGHGEQPLYTLHVSLRVGDMIVGEKTARIGFRHVRVNQEPHPEGGRYFVIEINNKQIFVKGGNFVPGDMIFARMNRDRYDRLTDLALEANFNFLRVWGGGLYESDDFYELCDEKGVLVWQEFIFACGRYPATDQAFHDNVTKEAVFNIRRLAGHPSLVAWCGNNEMEWESWGKEPYDKGVVFPDYSLFHLTLPRLLAEEDPTRYYQPSSPFSPDGAYPNRDDMGNQHPWSVGFGNTDFRDYRKMICRFANEGGILGPTSLPTLDACLPEGQKHAASFAWQVHDNSVDSGAEPSPVDGMILQWLGQDIRAMSLEDIVYRAGLVQGEGLREYCENFRRRMFDSAAAVFWMFNDCWPAVRSWTIVDYYLRRTPAFAPVRRALAPIHVVVAQEGDEVVVFGINETDAAVNGDLRYGLFNLAGGYPIDRATGVSLPPNASVPLASLKMSDWKHPNESVAFGMLSDGESLLARNRLVRPFFKDLSWPEPGVTVRVEDGKAVFSSDTFVWGVCLDLDGERPLPDNFFDIYPGIPYSLPWPSETAPTVLRVGNLI